MVERVENTEGRSILISKSLPDQIDSNGSYHKSQGPIAQMWYAGAWRFFAELNLFLKGMFGVRLDRSRVSSKDAKWKVEPARVGNTSRPGN